MSQAMQCPDILGQLSDERLVVEDVLQCALGVFPATTAIDRPVEVLLLVQNMTNAPLALNLTVRTPIRDVDGGLVNLFTAKPHIPLTLPAAECGMVHIPVIPQLPTRVGVHYPVRLEIDTTCAERFRVIRPALGGPAPSLLAISQFRLAVLRDIAFSAQSPAANQLEVTFEVLPGQLPPQLSAPEPRYEPLWTLHNLEEESQQIQAVAPDALAFANTLSRATLFNPLLDRTVTIFAQAGLPLHPGESMFITRALIYVLEDGLELEQGFSKAESYWFRRLCRLMVSDREVLNNIGQLVNLLHTAIVQDAVLLGFHQVAQITRADFGDERERADYAARLVAALEGRVPVALEHIYVPLVMMSLMLHGNVVLPGENLWNSLDDLKEARDGRISLAGAAFGEVFNLLDALIKRTEQLLRELRIPRD